MLARRIMGGLRFVCPGYPLTERPDNLSLRNYELDPNHLYSGNVLAFWTADDGGVEFKDRIVIPATDIQYRNGVPFGVTTLDTGSKLYAFMPQLQFVVRWYVTETTSYPTIINNEGYQSYGILGYWDSANNQVGCRLSTSGTAVAAVTAPGVVTDETVYGTSLFTFNNYSFINVNGQQTQSQAAPTNYYHGTNILKVGGISVAGARVNVLVILDSITADIATRRELQDNPWQLLRCI